MRPAQHPFWRDRCVRRWLIAAILSLLLAAPIAVRAQRGGGSDYVRANYKKYEYRVPMRDGVKLFTSVYAPKDARHTYPILMERTPYGVGPYGADQFRNNLGPSLAFATNGFIFVYQDVRGRGHSEGVFEDPPAHKRTFSSPADADESTDGYDTIDWLVKYIPNNNGRVGAWGVSYPGFFAAFTLIDSHPALKAVSPQAPMVDVGNGDDAYHNGAFFLAENFEFYTYFPPNPGAAAASNDVPFPYGQFDPGTPDEYEYFLRLGTLANLNQTVFQGKSDFWNKLARHDTYDKYWADHNLAPQMRRVTAPTLIVGGWFDAQDLAGPLKLFHAIDRDGVSPVTLVMGPWAHGTWDTGNGNTLGRLNFAQNTAAFYRQNIELPFFRRHLKEEGEGLKTEADPAVPKAWVFATGSDEWHRYDAWPPTNVLRRSIYLEAGGKLAFTPDGARTNQFDEYVSDPAKPVPVGGEIVLNLGGTYMTYDQRFASRRPDVLTYESEPLTTPLTIVGPVTAALRVSTSGTDSDFDVKLIDVYPDDSPEGQGSAGGRRGAAATFEPMGGFQQLVRGEPFRGKFRESLSQPAPFAPGKPAAIRFDMPDVMHTFLPGHRIMVQIQSTWFPLTDRNPQKFMDIPAAKDSDFQKATERVYRGGPDGSRLEVLELRGDVAK